MQPACSRGWWSRIVADSAGRKPCEKLGMGTVMYHYTTGQMNPSYHIIVHLVCLCTLGLIQFKRYDERISHCRALATTAIWQAPIRFASHASQ